MGEALRRGFSVPAGPDDAAALRWGALLVPEHDGVDQAGADHPGRAGKEEGFSPERFPMGETRDQAFQAVQIQGMFHQFHVFSYFSQASRSIFR